MTNANKRNSTSQASSQRKGKIEDQFWCDLKQQRRYWIACPGCTEFTTCEQITPQVIDFIMESGRYDLGVHSFKERRINMIVIRFNDDSLEFRDISIDELKGGKAQDLSNIKEVFQINKVFEPVVTLKPKPKSSLAEGEAVENKPTPRRRGTQAKK